MQERKKDDFSLNQLARKRFRVSEAVTRACVCPQGVGVSQSHPFLAPRKRRP